jgi:hypothetical protein
MSQSQQQDPTWPWRRPPRRGRTLIERIEEIARTVYDESWCFDDDPPRDAGPRRRPGAERRPDR